MEKKVLEGIGLSKGEVAVYFALLELGSSTTGPIVDRAKISSSKVYDILKRLIDKGLASYVIKSNKKYFEAAPASRIIDYITERKKSIESQEKEIQSILPEIEHKRNLSKNVQEVKVFKGTKGLRTVFEEILAEIKKEDLFLVFGSSASDRFRGFFNDFHKRRAKKGVRARMLFDLGARFTIGKDRQNTDLTKVKYLPQGYISPAAINIYGDNVTIMTWSQEPLTIVVHNKEFSNSFRSYFNLLWEQDVQVLNGQEGIELLCEAVLKEKRDLYLLGANAEIFRRDPPLFEDFERKRIQVGIKRHHLSIEETRGSGFNKLPLLDVKYLPPEFSSPLVIWIFGDYVANVLWEKEVQGFLIKNKKIADDYRKYFNVLWQQQARVYMGYEGVKVIFDDTLNEKEVYFISGGGYVAERMKDYFWNYYVSEAEKKKIKWYTLALEFVRGKPITKLPWAKFKYLPREFNTPNVVFIYGNKVVNVLWTENPMAFLIENKYVAKSYRDYFESLWKNVAQS